jgi:hypothetical protein
VGISRPADRKGHADMTTATLERTEVLAVTVTVTAPVLSTEQIMALNRAGVPRITCMTCGEHTARSNANAHSVCDACVDSTFPAHALYAPTGVAWRNGG